MRAEAGDVSKVTVRGLHSRAWHAGLGLGQGARLRAPLLLLGILLLCVVASALPADANAEQAAEPASPAAGQLDAGAFHTCAGVSGASLRCWGFSGNGQLGYGNTETIGDDETPASVGPVSFGAVRTAVAVSAGDFHTCGLLDDGSVRCWGFGTDGRLGYANTNSVSSPDSVGSVDLGGPAKAISAGGAHTCAVLVNGSVRCWGFGGLGRLGYGNTRTVGDDETPASVGSVDIGPGRTAVAISAGGAHTCVVLDNGAVRCWGEGASGQLGYGNKNKIGDDETPDVGRSLSDVACPSASQCTAVDDSGRQVTFNPTAPGTPTPTVVGGGSLTAVACPSVSQCTAVDNAGRQVTFNPTAPGAPTPTTIDTGPLSGVTCPSASQCTAVDDSGRQVTFNPTSPGSPTPTTLATGNPTAVACPSATQCTAVDGSGRQVTFNPTAPGTPTPTTIATRRLSGVACPSVSQCTAVDDSGRQLTFNPTAPGTPTPTNVDPVGPIKLGAGRTAKAISAGQSHTCAVLDNGDVRCWGDGGAGQLGYGSTATVGDDETPDTVGPVSLGAGQTAKSISAGDSHTCAVLDDGSVRSVRCWGLGASGRLGYGNQENIGDNETPASVGPVNLGVGRSPVAVSAGSRHTCARLDDGRIRCWGLGANGRLGYCNANGVGDDETPDTAGPVNLAPGDGGVSCARSPAGGPANVPSRATSGSARNKLPVASSDAVRLRGLRGCLAAVSAHAKRERRLAGRGSARRRARAKRHLQGHAASGRRRCLRLYGRTPGRITGLRARARGRTQIELSFSAPGSDGSHPPPAGSYVIKQSLRRIRGARDFARAQSLCRDVCRFSVSRVGAKVSLVVTDLRPHTSYYYAVVARDNISARRGPRSQTVQARTR